MSRFLVALFAIAVIAFFMGVMMFRALAAEIEEETASGLVVPASIRTEHKRLLSELDEALKAGGKTAEVAAQVQEVLMPHFAKEEEIALPPLGALRPCSEGKLTQEMLASVRSLSSRLKQEMPSMLREHQSISSAVSRLRQTASMERKEEVVKFTEELMQHAKNEEEVLYPAAIVVGECETNPAAP